MDDKELIRRLNDVAEDLYVLHGYRSESMRDAAARLTALAEENERMRQLLWSSREMLECAEYKDAENAQVALFVREQIAKLSEVPR